MSCLDADTVLAFLDGQLAPARAAEIEGHLDTCTACRRLVSEAAAAGDAPVGEDLRAPPERVGWYEVKERLAGARERYLAMDPRRAREVVLELIRGAEGEMLPDEAERAEKVLRPGAGVAHPNLVALLDAGRHGGAVFAVTELVDGEPLAARMARPVEIEQALGWLRGIARGLAAAHDRGLAHGRLTPADVIVQASDARARVADVAVARLLVAANSGAERDDVHAWGAIAHALLGGDPQLGKGSDDGARFPPGVPAAFAHVVRRALARSPSARFASARELAFVLDTLELAAPFAPPGDDSAPTSPVHVAALPRRRWWLLAPALVVAAAAAVWLALRRAPEPLPAAPPSPREPVTLARLVYRSGHAIVARRGPRGLYATIALGEGYGVDGFHTSAVHKRTSDGELARVPNTEGAVLVAASAARLAVLREPVYDGTNTRGMLALLDADGAAQPLAGDGADVVGADFLPDGGVAAVRVRAGVARVEAPLGAVVYQAQGVVWSLRASATGRLAFLEAVDGRQRITTLARGGSPVVLADDGVWRDVTSVAWDGDRLLVAARRGTVDNALWALDAAGPPRHLWSSPHPFVLEDVTADRELVIAELDLANRIWARRPDWPRDREVSWSDRSALADLTLDGRRLAMVDTSAGADAAPAIYVRALDGREAVPAGRGLGGLLSPDGRWVAARSQAAPWHVVLTGLADPWERAPGEPAETRALPAGDIRDYLVGSWAGDRLVVLAMGDRGNYVYTHTVDGPPHRVGAWPSTSTRGPFRVSPDGKYIGDADREGKPALIEVATLAVTRLPHAGTVVGWSADGAHVYLAELRWPLAVVRVPVARPAEAEPVLAIEAPGPGLLPPSQLRVAGDGRTYAYSAQALRATLYRVRGALRDDPAP
ncbi:MAG: zf-HC2 domain-containing protein [Deltaproteobacteria bacterium]|nr:zf-HC2 domain-containing protein [Deltaproteobacteria bacterium]